MKYSGIALKKIRKNLDLTQEEFGRTLNAKKQFISDLENGSKPITDRMALLLQEKYNVNPSYLLTGEGSMYLSSAQDAEKSAQVSAQEESELEKFVTETELDELVNVLSENKILLLQCLSAIQHHKKELKLFLAGLD